MNARTPTPPLPPRFARPIVDHAGAAETAIEVDRREMLRVSFGSALALGMSAAAGDDTLPDRAVILLWMNGGPSHIDSFDPKPGVREGGPFGRIQTRLPGIAFTDKLPALAERADKLAIVRSVVGIEPEHQRAQYYASTGYRPLPSVDAPSIGSIVGFELGSRAAAAAGGSPLPAYLSIGQRAFGPGCLGRGHEGFVLWEPGQLPESADFPGEVGRRRFERRLRALEAFEKASAADRRRLAEDRAGARERAAALLRSEELRAFDLAREPARMREAYGDSKFGRGCLLARRLVEAGVRFVQVHLDGWDSHVDNFPTHERLLGEVDRSMSALLDDLSERGLYDRTLVVWMGEFGRTPRINGRGGRDHHIACWSVLLGGAGAGRGLVHGQTDAKGSAVTRDKVAAPDLLATILAAVGVRSDRELPTQGGRKLRYVDAGAPVRALLA